MNETQLREQYEKQKPSYASWGNIVAQHILTELSRKDYDISAFIKVPSDPRVKETNSFIEKALYRSKNYQNPLLDITDKVGVRFVVLNLYDIEIIKEIINSTKEWDISLDRDFEEEKKSKPELFTYQSVHYIVRNRSIFNYNGYNIETGTPCEIQIRTLLQHAYAELSHDIVYKKTDEVPSRVKRKFARSMALIEATDELFKEVQELVNYEDAQFKDFISNMKLYTSTSNYSEKLNKYIYDAYKPLLQEESITAIDIKHFISDHSFLQTKVKGADELILIRKQPITYLIYYLIEKYRNQVVSLWPLSEVELQPLFIDMGKSIEQYI
ncbi:MAG: GTP pyrophosphokinase [Christensenellales bacterium]|jgi:putative GTP pyrophosphokinase